MTKVYIIDINKDIKNIVLPSNLVDRVSKYKLSDDYNNSYIAWSNLYLILKEEYNIDISCIDILENEYGKPFINDIYFNLSHSNNIVTICISDEQCGIDVEMVNPKKDLSLLMKKILSSNELNQSDVFDYFIMKWTKIESYFKYNGTGIVYSKINDVNIDSIFTYDILDSQNNKYYISVKSDDNIVELINNNS